MRTRNKRIGVYPKELNVYGYKDYEKHKEYVCDECKETFQLIEGEMLYKFGKNKFCSYNCRSKFKRRMSNGTSKY